jgi:polar amino acid transport system permease protein
MGMSPRKRARISRGVQYVVLAVVVVVIVLSADWTTIKDKFADPDIALAMFPEVITTALKNTIIYTACGSRPSVPTGGWPRRSSSSSAVCRPWWSSSP